MKPETTATRPAPRTETTKQRSARKPTLRVRTGVKAGCPTEELFGAYDF